MPEEIEVPTEHLHEHMNEAAEEKGGWISRVAVSSAILAVLAAITALLASHHSDEAILEQMKATDQWSDYQAKSIKASIAKNDTDRPKDAAQPVPAERVKKMDDYARDMKEIKDKGDELEASSEGHMQHHVWLARGVTAFQIAIAMGAISVLAKRQKLWLISLALGALGAAGLVAGLMA